VCAKFARFCLITQATMTECDGIPALPWPWSTIKS